MIGTRKIMHEQERMAGVIATLLSLAGDEVIAEVEIALGHGVEREGALRSWSTLTKGTELEDARVIWERSLDLFRCSECGRDYTGDRLEVCPYCGADGVLIETAPSVSLGHWIVKDSEPRR
jgi:Zn finger protein HypA/HybF involved in hydrogenase expression